MSTKEEKPTLAGVNVKTRKRNIVVPADPGSFATAIVQIFQVGAGNSGPTSCLLPLPCCPLDVPAIPYIHASPSTASTLQQPRCLRLSSCADCCCAGRL